MSMCSCSASPIWRLIVSTGLSEVMGSWKIMAISLPRICRISFLGHPDQVLALEQHLAAGDFAGRLGIRPMIESAVTLLPDPLSPTMPSVSSSYRSKETPLTAFTTPSCVKNCVLRSLTCSNAAM